MTKLQDTLINKLQKCEELKECGIDHVRYLGTSSETNNYKFAVVVTDAILGSALSRLEFMGFKVRYISPTKLVYTGAGLSIGLEYVGHNVR